MVIYHDEHDDEPWRVKVSYNDSDSNECEYNVDVVCDAPNIFHGTHTFVEDLDDVLPEIREEINDKVEKNARDDPPTPTVDNTYFVDETDNFVKGDIFGSNLQRYA
jgi:hypothetical protein